MNPECKRIRPLLSPYFDGETDDNETRLVRQHLPGCPDCQAELDDYRLIRTQFSRMRHPSAPPELRRAVLAEVHAVRIGTARRGFNPALRFAPLIAGIATIAVAVILLVLVLGNTNKSNVEVAEVRPAADGSALVTFNQSINPDVLEKNPDLIQITDAKGKKIEADVKKIDDKTIRVMPKQDEITAPEEPLKVTANKSGGQPPIVASVPPQPTATSTRAPATPTPTTRPAQTTPPAQTTAAGANPTTAAGASPTATRTTAPATTAAATVTPVPIATPTVTAGTTVTPTVGATVPVTTTTTAGPTITVTATTTVTTTTTVTPTVATTPTVGATITPTAATGCAINPIRGFGKVYKEQANLAQSLGCPTEQERQATMAYQAFNGGTMLYDQRSNRIFVLFKTGGTFQSFTNTFQEGEATPAPVTAPVCNAPPTRGFGKIWLTNSGVRQALGCPLAPENSSSLAATENFERGTLFSYPNASNGKRIYVLLNNGTYLDLADTFVG